MPQRRARTRVVLAVLVFLVGAEGVARFTWKNPYDYEILGADYLDSITLNPPNMEEEYDAAGLYEGAGIVLFRTGSMGEVLGRPRPGQPEAYFFGDGTTETRYVSEGARWPELIESVSAVNFGQPRATILDIYLKFKFLLQARAAPAEVFVMTGATDFASRTYFGVERWRRLVVSRRRYEKSPPPFLAKKLYLEALRRRALATLFEPPRARPVVMEILRSAAAGTGAVSESEGVSEHDFAVFLESDMGVFLVNRSAALHRLATLAREGCVRLTLLTQPHAYREEYHPLGADLRRFPVVVGRALNVAQARHVMDVVNHNTRTAAAELALGLVDLARVFEARGPAGLLYDAVHYTESGSKVVAETINEARRANNSASSSDCAAAREMASALADLRLLRVRLDGLRTSQAAPAPRRLVSSRLLIEAGLVPPALVDGVEILHPWGGTLALTLDPTETILDLSDVPRAVCVELLRRAGAVGAERAATSGAAAFERAVPVPPRTAIADCGKDKNFVRLIAAPHAP